MYKLLRSGLALLCQGVATPLVDSVAAMHAALIARL